MSLTMGQQLAVRRMRSADPTASAETIAKAIHATSREVQAVMRVRTPQAPVLRAKKTVVAKPPAEKIEPYFPSGRTKAGIQEPPRMVIPRDVLLERERRMALSPKSFTASQFGDPLPGYSALDKRQGA